MTGGSPVLWSRWAGDRAAGLRVSVSFAAGTAAEGHEWSRHSALLGVVVLLGIGVNTPTAGGLKQRQFLGALLLLGDSCRRWAHGVSAAHRRRASEQLLLKRAACSVEPRLHDFLGDFLTRGSHHRLCVGE